MSSVPAETAASTRGCQSEGAAADCGGVVAEADDGVGAERAGVRAEALEGVLPRAFAEGRVERDVATEERLKPGADVADDGARADDDAADGAEFLRDAEAGES